MSALAIAIAQHILEAGTYRHELGERCVVFVDGDGAVIVQLNTPDVTVPSNPVQQLVALANADRLVDTDAAIIVGIPVKRYVSRPLLYTPAPVHFRVWKWCYDDW